MIKKTIVFLLSFLTFYTTKAQDDEVDYTGRELNAILTTVPFLTIAPDSRSGAMGDAGVATSPDLYSQHWNPAKYVFMEDQFGIGLSYTPWLKNLGVTDLNLLYLSGFYKFDQRQSISGAIRYFNLGTIQYTTSTGEPAGTGKPNEFAIDAGYSMMFSDYFSGGLVFRFIYSDIAGGQGTLNNIEYNKGISFASDLAVYYQRPIQLSDYEAEMAYGLNISNIGSKMSYSEGDTKEFIPTNMRLGGRLSVDLDEYNSIGVTVDFNKLLVPTPAEYEGDSLIAGMSNDVGTLKGMIQSFYDAPGQLNNSGERSVFKEELHEIMISGGLEYWYRDQFAVRAGYFYEHESKGNRKYITTGIGLKLNVFSLDFSYLIATGRTSPLNRTMRFTLGFIFE
jgi:hypothetical protein